MSERYLIIRKSPMGQKFPKSKVFQIAAWKYYEIVEELYWLDVERQEAYDAAKWAMKAKPGDHMNIGILDLAIVEK